MLKNLTAEKQRYYERYSDGHISRDELDALREPCNEQIDGLTEKIGEINALIADCDALINDMAHTTEEWQNALNATCLSKELVDALVDSIIVYDSEHVEIRWKFADEYAIL